MKKIIAALLPVFGYNLNPTAPIQDQIRLFTEKKTENIKIYKGIHRNIGFAHSGDIKSRPVIFIHGSPGKKDVWYSFLLSPQLNSKFHLIAVDRPGYGQSGTNSERSLKKQAEDIWEVMKFNQSGINPILVGHSYGGAIIAKMAMLYPEKVRGLIFVASSVDPSLEKIKLIQLLGDLWGIRSIIPNDLRVCNEEILALKKELDEIKNEWKKIEARVAVVHGDSDDLVPIENVSFINSKVKVDSTQILKGMNHFIPWQMPQTIEKAICEIDSL